VQSHRRRQPQRCKPSISFTTFILYQSHPPSITHTTLVPPLALSLHPPTFVRPSKAYRLHPNCILHVNLYNHLSHSFAASGGTLASSVVWSHCHTSSHRIRYLPHPIIGACGQTSCLAGQSFIQPCSWLQHCQLSLHKPQCHAVMAICARRARHVAHVSSGSSGSGLLADNLSEYGQCGVGAYCLGGCDPVNSFSLNSCVPNPVCKSQNYDFQNLNGMVENTKYLGDASTADWVYSGVPLSYTNGGKSQVLLTMAQGTVGTLLASTHYVWYGKVTGVFSTSAGAGVVTAFILLSDVKDEIDFEFVGVELTSAQTNFYNQGVTNYNNGDNSTGLSDVHLNMHTYEIDWQPDSITWSIDGKSIRTLNRDDTWNATANRYSYPQTPARLQLSLWPAGLPSNAQGTINWAGGEIDWNSPYMQNGYYYASFDSVNIECYDPPSGANVTGSKSYIYNDLTATNASVAEVNDQVILGSFLATGTNPEEGSQSASAGSSQTSTANTIPGVSGAGPGTNGQRGSGSSSSSSSTSTGGSATAAATGSASTGFVQGPDSSGAGRATIDEPGKALQGSLFAAIMGICGLLML
jgi:beta-glucanase (GH16 family)